MVLIPEGFRELRASGTSSSDMFMETKRCLTEASTLTSLFVHMKLLVEKLKRKNLLNISQPKHPRCKKVEAKN